MVPATAWRACLLRQAEFGQYVLELGESAFTANPTYSEKFRRLARVVVSAESSERLLTLARNLDDVRDISTLAPLLTASR